MALSVIVSGEIELAGREDRDRAIRFARGGPLPDDRPSEPKSSILIVRRGGGDHRRGEILGHLSTSRRSVTPPGAPDGDVFLIDGLRLHPDLAGFTPGAHRLLIALAVALLAWTEADNEDRAALVAIRVHIADRRVREDLRMLRARRMPHAAAMDHGLFAMSPDLPTSQPVEYWEVTPEMAQQCARLVAREARAEDPWRIDRVSGVRQQLRLSLSMPWLRLGSPLLEALAEGSSELPWGPLPTNDVVEPPGRVTERERPDGDQPAT